MERKMQKKDFIDGDNSDKQNNRNGSLTTQEWMTTEEAADYLRVSVGALRNMTSSGLVPFHKLGDRNRYMFTELRDLLLKQKRGGI